MTREDLFGLDREAKILKSKVRDTFTPHQPVNSLKLFFGRQQAVQKLIEHINTPGQHSLLYGERGVGKSSLANVACRVILSRLTDGQFFEKRCDSSDTFVTILREPLKHYGFLDRPQSSQRKSTTEENVGVDAKLLKGSKGTGTETIETFDGDVFDPTPSSVAKALRNKKGLLLLDEVDALAKATDRKQLASLVKLLSDYGSPFKFLIVGVAETGDELTASHPSVGRCLKETRLKRMLDQEIREIVTGGASLLNLEFNPAVVSKITSLSAGYAHFTHLLALKCAEEVVATDRSRVELNDLWKACHLASEDAEGSLTRMYNRAVRSNTTDMYKTVMLAATHIDKTEFSATEWRTEISALTGQQISQGSLNNYLQRLVAEDTTTIFRRVGRGMYRFNDPRMASYIRIINKDEITSFT